MIMFVSIIFVSLLCQSVAKFSPWNSWSACSTECGKGWATRERIAVLSECYSELSEKKDCEVTCKSGTNIALNKTVTSSSTFLPSFPSSNIVDGNTDTDFYGGKSCMMTKKDEQPWVQIDLGKTALVNKVTIFNRGDCCSYRLNNVIVEVSNDTNGTQSKECGKRFDMENVNFTRISCVETLYGRYILIKINGPQFLSICEVEVFGGLMSNLSLGKSASQSSLSSSGYEAGKAVDGDLDTYSCTHSIANEWWRVDLGKLAIIYEIRFYAYAGGATYEGESQIKIAKNAEKENMILCGILYAKYRKAVGSYYAYDITCVDNTFGQFVEVQKADYSHELVIRELEVHGYFVE